MRVFLIIILLATANLALAQDQVQDSLLQLDEVAVYGRNAQLNLVGSRVIMPGENLIDFNKQSSLTALLNSQSSTYLKSYGNNMLSTISFRGTNASQTSVLWNNFNINNYTLGQTDFSTVPLSVTDEVTLIPGGGSSFGGSGAIGGTVALANPLFYRKGSSVEIQQSVGSFNTYRTLASLQKSTDKISLNINAYHNVSENDFLIPERNLRQEHASYQSFGALTALGYKLSDDQKLELTLWYNDNYREIQPTLSGRNANSNQKDINVRTSLQHHLEQEFFILHSGFGYFNDKLDYWNGNAQSFFNVNRFEAFSNITRSLSENHLLHAEVRSNLFSAQNTNYEKGTASEERYSFLFQARGDFFNQLNYALHLKQLFVSSSNEAPLAPYAGLSLEILKASNHHLIIKGSSSINYRVPTLNDRFWLGSGDPNLDSERGFNSEIGLEHYFKYNHVSNQTGITLYRNLVDNFIQWVPDSIGTRSENMVSKPENIKSVRISGIEFNNETEVNLNNLLLRVNLGYSYTQSIITNTESVSFEEGKQLIYVPLHQANLSLSASLSQFEFSYLASFTDKVFTTPRNSEAFALDAYFLHDLGFKYRIPFNFSAGLKIRNLLNQNYQTYQGYAMPGINYELTINYKLKTK